MKYEFKLLCFWLIDYDIVEFTFEYCFRKIITGLEPKLTCLVLFSISWGSLSIIWLRCGCLYALCKKTSPVFNGVAILIIIIFTLELESHVGKDVAIAILIIVLIVVVVAVALFLIRRCVRQRRLGKFRGLPTGGGSGLNFTTLEEEQDIDYQRSGKLQIVGSASNA